MKSLCLSRAGDGGGGGPNSELREEICNPCVPLRHETLRPRTAGQRTKLQLVFGESGNVFL